jgi:hypothetical protein
MIIHGWARNAPALTLPEGIFKMNENNLYIYILDLDVGFKVGRNSPYKYIVLNIHYLSILQNDNSGNQLIMSRKPYVNYLNIIKTKIFIIILDVNIMQVLC